MNIALILAGGTGQRMQQDVPKQFLCIDNKPIIIYTLENFQKCDLIDAIVVACSVGWEVFVEAYARQFNITKLRCITQGGENRFMSVLNLLKRLEGIAADDDVVLIYDAVRPFISDDIISDAITKVRNIGAAVGVIPCFDTMFTVKNEKDELLNDGKDRNLLYRGMGPEATTFKRALDLYESNIAQNQNLNLLEMLLLKGYKVAKSCSSPKCIKLTTVEDIELFHAILKYEKYDWLK